mmetsp:Transcript_15515/g.39276  ORF Transcript_15515/g.39276 Transcript_15515/m.39276 type:complete len:357 (-) Transcript_15515:747-1817(-)
MAGAPPGTWQQAPPRPVATRQLARYAQTQHPLQCRPFAPRPTMPLSPRLGGTTRLSLARATMRMIPGHHLGCLRLLWDGLQVRHRPRGGELGLPGQQLATTGVNHRHVEERALDCLAPGGDEVGVGAGELREEGVVPLPGLSQHAHVGLETSGVFCALQKPLQLCPGQGHSRPLLSRLLWGHGGLQPVALEDILEGFWADKQPGTAGLRLGIRIGHVHPQAVFISWEDLWKLGLAGALQVRGPPQCVAQLLGTLVAILLQEHITISIFVGREPEPSGQCVLVVVAAGLGGKNADFLTVHQDPRAGLRRPRHQGIERPHHQGGAHHDQQVAGLEVLLGELGETLWQALPEEHNVGLD